jgi:DNA-binding NarL/FixJ family response regulator
MVNSPEIDASMEALRGVIARSQIRRKIIALMLRGYPRKAIAAMVERSPHTIDGHIKAIYRAVGVGDKTRLGKL